jgi:hypothetical protein
MHLRWFEILDENKSSVPKQNKTMMSFPTAAFTESAGREEVVL